MPNDWVRCVSLSPTEGLERGIDVVDTGAAVKVPVGKTTLGRLFNVLGEPLDGLGDVQANEKWVIHRSARLLLKSNPEPPRLWKPV